MPLADQRTSVNDRPNIVVTIEHVGQRTKSGKTCLVSNRGKAVPSGDAEGTVQPFSSPSTQLSLTTSRDFKNKVRRLAVVDRSE